MAAAAVRAAEELAEREMAGRDASHDAAHALRVRDLALSLAAELGLSSSPDRLLIVEIAALLHDIEVELEQGQREEIVAIIKGMGFKNEVSKKSVVEPTLEFAIVQDADRLDAIGAIGKYCLTEVSLSALLKQSFLQQLGCSKCCTGYAKSLPCTILFFPLLPLDSDGINLSSIARCFTYGGSKKNTLHDPKILPRDNLSKEKYMSKDEKQTSINHFHEKLFKLKDMMKTEAGKKRAEKRHKFMEDFVAEFYEEWSGRA
uniref:HD/PDEase domain-containing protein n=1 Tax=Oryza nivara TaxID=4536 RepID=A0A0E0IU80_ORYNI